MQTNAWDLQTDLMPATLAVHFAVHPLSPADAAMEGFTNHVMLRVADCISPDESVLYDETWKMSLTETLPGDAMANCVSSQDTQPQLLLEWSRFYVRAEGTSVYRKIAL